MMAMDHQGIMGLDITGYGNYGWATKTPVKTIADAKKVKFRIAEAEVNQLLYKEWGFNPVVMPWPDVPMALKQGVIDGLDHTPMVCNITKKFEDAKFFTQLNYAQGLFIWIFNKASFATWPADLQKTFVDTVHEVCADIRKLSKAQEEEEIAKAKAAGVTFFQLPAEDMATLAKQGDAAHKKYAAEINKLYPEVEMVKNYSEMLKRNLDAVFTGTQFEPSVISVTIERVFFLVIHAQGNEHFFRGGVVNVKTEHGIFAPVIYRQHQTHSGIGGRIQLHPQ